MDTHEHSGLATHRLKDGREVFHLNKYETEFLYKELFEDRVYLKNGIRLDQNSVIVDVGANIGLFAVLLQSEFPGCRTVLVEPSPKLCEIIRANTRSFADKVTVVQNGISNARRWADFTFYTGYSMLSGFKAELNKDTQLLRESIRNQVSTLNVDAARAEKNTAKLLDGKLANAQKFRVELIGLDDLISSQMLSQIDLLKVDAEGCELEILQGISAENWLRIRQIVMEIHEGDGLVSDEIERLLISKNFRVQLDQADNFKVTGVFNLYAFQQ